MRPLAAAARLPSSPARSQLLPGAGRHSRPAVRTLARRGDSASSTLTQRAAGEMPWQSFGAAPKRTRLAMLRAPAGAATSTPTAGAGGRSQRALATFHAARPRTHVAAELAGAPPAAMRSWPLACCRTCRPAPYGRLAGGPWRTQTSKTFASPLIGGADPAARPRPQPITSPAPAQGWHPHHTAPSTTLAQDPGGPVTHTQHTCNGVQSPPAPPSCVLCTALHCTAHCKRRPAAPLHPASSLLARGAGGAPPSAPAGGAPLPQDS